MIDKIDGKVESLMRVLYGRAKIYLGILAKWIRNFKDLINRHKLAAKLISGSLLILIITGICLYEFIPREVTLVIDDSKTVKWTSSITQTRTVETYLKESGIEFSTRDDIEPELTEKVTNNMKIVVTKAFRIPIMADGKERGLLTTRCTVKEILKKASISVKKDDIVSPKLTSVIRKDDKIVVKRVTKKKKSFTTKDEYETVTRADGSMRIGKVAVTQKGRLGKSKKTYEYTYIDGKLSKKKLIAKKVVKKPRTKIIGYGTKISFDSPSGLSYRRKFTVKAVSYYMPGNPYGAYGGPCRYGTMAVDPSVIPLGTKCYVEGYGYAIANDVGSGVKGNKIDLYMEKYSQCLMWGAHYTTIYILN